MLRTIKNRARTHTRLLLGAFLSLWLGAALVPCVMAASACSNMTSSCPDTVASAVTAVPCEQATPDCAAPEMNTPVSALIDFTPAPGFMITLPAEALAPVVVPPPAVTQPRARPARTPIYIEHLALLN